MRVAQDAKQRIAPDLQAFAFKRVREQMVQFARPKSGLTQPLGANQLNHLFVALAHLGRSIVYCGHLRLLSPFGLPGSCCGKVSILHLLMS